VADDPRALRRVAVVVRLVATAIDPAGGREDAKVDVPVGVVLGQRVADINDVNTVGAVLVRQVPE
jgi:hypothetical protein